MLVTLQITSGPAAGTRTHLRTGQVLQVGRTEWADFAVPDDDVMADVHFALECDAAQCRLRDISAGGGTQLNGDPVNEARVYNGDRIVAGGTTFAVQIDGIVGARPAAAAAAVAVVAAAPAEGEQPPLDSGFKHVDTALARDVCARCTLEDDATKLLKPDDITRAYFERLVERGLHLDAIRFLAHALPKREAVWWAIACLPEDLPDEDETLAEVAEQWAVDPSEENRQAALAAGDASEMDTAASWVALAAAWSGVSMAAPQFEPVPPAENQTARTVTAAISLSAVADEAAETIANRAAFLEVGVQIADGEDRWDAVSEDEPA